MLDRLPPASGNAAPPSGCSRGPEEAPALCAVGRRRTEIKPTARHTQGTCTPIMSASKHAHNHTPAPYHNPRCMARQHGPTSIARPARYYVNGFSRAPHSNSTTPFRPAPPAPPPLPSCIMHALLPAPLQPCFTHDRARRQPGRGGVPPTSTHDSHSEGARDTAREAAALLAPPPPPMAALRCWSCRCAAMCSPVT